MRTTTLPPFERFMSKVVWNGDEGECWTWEGAKKPKGYGSFSPAHDRTQIAHRYAYEQFVGPIPAGLHLDHLCRNRARVNPAHLEPVTPRENVLRGVGISAQHAKKTHCPQGHPYSGDNLLYERGSRICRICKREKTRLALRRMRQRRKEEAE